MKYEYETNCVNSNGPDINAMVEQARQITYETFMRHVGVEQVKEIFPMDFYQWGTGRGLRLKNDYAVSFYKSIFQGKNCYYIVHSAIEYIFTSQEVNR